MAKLKTITYGRKVTDGDYGSFHLEVTIELDESDSGREALKAAREFVHKGLGLKMTKPAEPEAKHT